MQVITTATDEFINTFSSYFSKFMAWGQWLFVGLLTINVVIMCLWYAFDRDSFQDSVGQFIRKFFVIAVFYTIMVNHQWLIQLFDTSKAMGHKLIVIKTDPSSIIDKGLAIANNVWHSVPSLNILKITNGAIIMLIVYIVTIFTFITIGLQLAVILITTQILIVVSTFLLGFAALSATSQIARNTLDAILGNCVKLLGLYLVIGTGQHVIETIEASIPSKGGSFDAYWGLLAAILLFGMLAKIIPDQLAKLVSGIVQDTQNHSAAALALSAVQYAAVAAKSIEYASATLGGVAEGLGKLGDNKTASNKLQSSAAAASPSPHGIGASPTGTTGSQSSTPHSSSSNLSNHFGKLSEQMKGKSSLGGDPHATVPGVAERMQQTMQPKSSGRKSAGSRKLRSQPKKS